MMKKVLLYILIICGGCNVYSQDSRERNYFYEILTPNHEAKPQVNGFAKERIEEKLNRGLTIGKAKNKGVYLSWRWLKSDDDDTKFNVFRSIGDKTKKLNKKPIERTTDFIDTDPMNENAVYWIEAIHGKTSDISEKVALSSFNTKDINFKSIKLRNNIVAGKVALADLNGDGEYDFIIRHPNTNVDPGMPGDTTGITYKIEAYLSDGTYLWTKDLGLGIEPGIWYSPFVSYDFNGDGKAEIALKTAGDNYKRDQKSRIYAGDEYLCVLDGMTGKEISRVDWPKRNNRLGNLNRQNRNQIGVAFLDGKTPCILAARGTYRMMAVEAWQLKDGKFENLWKWDGDEENPVVRSQGAHNMVSGDVDGDGRDEILLGSCMLDDNGTLLWSSGLGHSDKSYLTDIDPQREGMEVFLVMEPWQDNGYGVCVLDAKTGQRVWGIGHKTFHVGDGMVADIDPTHLGLECFASEDKKGGSTDKYLLNAKGEKIGMNEDVPPCRNWVWWDAGNIRQTFFGDNNQWGASSSSGGRSQSIGYWKGEKLTNGIMGDIMMTADVFGDWREEVITALPGELRIYFTNYPAKNKQITLMQDPIYRSYVMQRSQGYPQSPVTSYYLGE